MSTKIPTIEWKFKEIPLQGYNYDRRKKVQQPEDFYNIFKEFYKNEVVERFCVVWLTTAQTILGFEEISKGVLNQTVVAPREIFRGAIVASCSSIILMHNHPSGNPEPSIEDISITKKLVETGKIIDINVLDHIIFTNEGFTSLTLRHIL